MEETSINEIYTALKNEFPELNVLKSYPITEPKFPCVILDYGGDITDLETIDTSGEKYSIGTIITDVFVDGTDRNNESIRIQKRVNNILTGTYRMARATQDVTNNFLNKDLRRIRTVYDFKVDENETIYRR